MATASNNKQREMQLLADIKEDMRRLPDGDVACCDTEQRAFHLCIKESRIYRSQADIAESIGMCKSDFNCALNADINDRPKYLSRTRQVNLQLLCGNRAIDQWADLYERRMLNCQRTAEQQLAELEEQKQKVLERMEQVS